MNDIKCSKECYQKNINCYEKGNMVQFKQFEQMEYEHAGKTKKKRTLVSKSIEVDQFDNLLNQPLQPFITHRFNVQHTKEKLQHLFDTLCENEIVLIQDFSAFTSVFCQMSPNQFIGLRKLLLFIR